MLSRFEVPMAKGVAKALRILLLILVFLYYVLSIAYVVVSNTFVAGIGIIPMTVSGVLSLSELGVLDRLLPKRGQEYNIVLGDGIGRKPGYRLRTTCRLLFDIALIISFLLIVIFIIIELIVLPYYYFNTAVAFLGSYCTMPLILGLVSHLTLVVITIADMLKSDLLCAQCGGGMVQDHDAGHGSAVGGSEGSPAAT